MTTHTINTKSVIAKIDTTITNTILSDSTNTYLILTDSTKKNKNKTDFLNFKK